MHAVSVHVTVLTVCHCNTLQLWMYVTAAQGCTSSTQQGHCMIAQNMQFRGPINHPWKLSLVYLRAIHLPPSSAALWCSVPWPDADSLFCRMYLEIWRIVL